MSPRKPKDDTAADVVDEPAVDTAAVGRNVAPVPANAGDPALDLDAGQPAGEDIRGGVRFVELTHPEIDGSSQSVPEHLVEFWGHKGWVPVDQTDTPSTDDKALAVIEELGDLVDDEPTTGAPSGEATTESEED